MGGANLKDVRGLDLLVDYHVNHMRACASKFEFVCMHMSPFPPYLGVELKA